MKVQSVFDKFISLIFSVILSISFSYGNNENAHDAMLRPYDDFLKKYVDMNGVVNYKAIYSDQNSPHS